ncbi:MAG: hypothetical protein GX201_06920 [Clostridiales bacterium]|nr:hypothetical protein [Clostridiales bacterium]
MALIALLSCTKTKKPYRCKAREMYSESRWFPKAYEYVKRIGANKIFILSSLYGLVPEDKEIDYYEKTLNDCSDSEKKEWAQRVLSDLKCEANLEKDNFIIIAGKNYYEYLIPYLKNVTLPLKGLGIYYWESTLDKLIKDISNNTSSQHQYKTSINKQKDINYSYNLHKLLNELPRIRYPFDFDKLPNSGIYIMFEEGEKYFDFDRIVRVGTHRSPNRLKGRLRDHFIIEDKDGSIFRKNIGRAILNKNHDAFLKVWEYDLSKTEDNEILQRANPAYQAIVEEYVTRYIRTRISFVVIGEIMDANERLRLEEGIIATLNNDKQFAQSTKWLGNYSPVEKIRSSGLWLVEGLNAEPLTESEFERIKQLVGTSNYDKKDIKITSQCETKKVNQYNSNKFAEVLKEILEKAKIEGKDYIDVESGYLHRLVGGYPGRNHKMPLCCRVMRSFMNKGDIILYSPPSGKGATLKIRYYLK